MESPSGAPEAPSSPGEVERPKSAQYGGMGRLPYWGVMIALVVAYNFLAARVAAGDSTGAAGLGIAVIFVSVSFVPAYYRLKNIGMNPWWCLLLLVPIANLLVGFRCLVFQEGYQDTRKLDTAGRIMFYIFFAYVVYIAIQLSLGW